MELPGVFGTVAPFIQHYGYLAVAVFVLLENVGLFVPGEAVLVTAAIFAGAGQLDLVGVAAVAFVAAVAGDNIGYAVGRLGGRVLVLRLGRRVGLTESRLAKVEQFFGRYGTPLIVFARFLPVLRHGNGVAAGTSAMPWRRFLAGNVVGAALWATVWTFVGRVGSAHLDGIDAVLRVGGPALLAALVVVAGALVIRRRVRRRARRRVELTPEPALERLI